MNKNVTFEYQGKSYAGYIIASTEYEPHYYWLFFDDVNMVQRFGDSIGFKIIDDELVPTQKYTSDKEFVESVKMLIEENLFKSS